HRGSHVMVPEETVSFLGNAASNVDADIQELQKYENAIYSTSINNIAEESAEKIKDAWIKLHIYSVNTDAAYEKAKSKKPRLIEMNVILPQNANKYLDFWNWCILNALRQRCFRALLFF